MPNIIESLPDNPALDAYVAAHGAWVKSPAGFARELIREHAKNHWAMDIDPDQICITVLSFNPPPVPAPYPAKVDHGLTLTEALLNNYQSRPNVWNGHGAVAHYKSAGIELRLVDTLWPNRTVQRCEGLYRRSVPAVYNASTHLDIDPAAVRQFIKQTDLKALYHTYLETFLAAHAVHFRSLAKAALLKAAFLQTREKTLSEADRDLVLEALGLADAQQWQTLTPAHLQAPVAGPRHIVVAPLKVHRYSATDILLIKDTRTARTLLYIPGNSSPLHGFDSERKLAEWLAGQCHDAGKRLALAAHFKERDDSDGLFLSGLHTTLEGVAAYPHRLNDATGTWVPRHYLHAGKRINGDVFAYVHDRLVDRLRADARSVIHTRGEARLEGFAEGLSRSLVLTGLIALMVPEAIPFIMGLSVTLIGVGGAQVLQGKTLEQRTSALGRVEFGLFNALPLAAEGLSGMAAGASESTQILDPLSAVENDQAFAGQGAVTHVVRPRFEFAPPNLRSLEDGLRLSLKAFEAAPESVQGQPIIHGPNGMLDIYHHEGRYFVPLHDKAYQVRWEEPCRQWRIVSADLKPGPLIKQLESDQWDLDLGGLKGGMQSAQVLPAQPSAEVPSLHAQVEALYPGFTPQQAAEYLAQLRANGGALEIQLARLSMEFQSLERSLDRWVRGPLTWRPITETHSVPVSGISRSEAADIIKRCWQRQTPVTGRIAQLIDGYTLDLSGLVIGDLPYLPGDFSHVTAINLARTYISQQSVSALVGRCPDLRWLNVENNFLSVVPVGIRHLRRLTRLTLANNRIALSAVDMQTLRSLPRLRLLNLERNPIGPLLDVSEMPQLLNLFLRGTGIEQAPAGVFDIPSLIALDLRNNRITALPEAYFQRADVARHTLLDGNPLSVATRLRIAGAGGPPVGLEEAETVEFWLYETPALERVRHREIWELLWTQPHAVDFFEVIARLQGSADFNNSRSAVTHRVWALLEAAEQDPALRARLIGMAANPETCVDAATVIFSNMELEVLVSRARSMAGAVSEGAQLLKLLRGLFRLEEVDGIARLDAAARIDFSEDIEVLLAYRTGLAARLELPISTRSMQFSGVADVTPQALDAAQQAVLNQETPQALTDFALKREFWVNYLKAQHADQFLAIQRPTVIRMEALDDLHSASPLSDADYKKNAEKILQQRQQDEETLMIQLTQAELAGVSRGNEV